MAVKQGKVGSLAALVILGIFAALPARASSTVVGAVVAAKNASVGGDLLLPGHTIFSGDDLRVREDGIAQVTMGKGSRLVFRHDTVASFERDSNQVTALLTGGNASVYQPTDDNVPLRLKVGNLSIVPVAGFRTLGEVAVTDQEVVVRTSEGLLRVETEGTGQMFQVPKGKEVKFVPKKTAAAPQAQGGAQPRRRKKRGAFFWLPVDGAIVLAAVLASRGGGSDTDPACTAAKLFDSMFPNLPEASESEPPGTCADD